MSPRRSASESGSSADTTCSAPLNSSSERSCSLACSATRRAFADRESAGVGACLRLREVGGELAIVVQAVGGSRQKRDDSDGDEIDEDEGDAVPRALGVP